ncbi:MAG TPA: MMPL family transporter [Solirubrobacterales bacterium]|jgi:RND superfamily putative drug exporter|nr:MMPL family transporter [Solirubrobacterales bacterium]
MAATLQRLGRISFRHRRRVLALWLGVLVLIAVIGAAASKPFSEEFKIPGTGSQQAIDLLKAKLPAASGASGQVVFAAPSGGQVKDDAASIESSIAAAEKTPGVVSITNPLETPGAVSKDGAYALADVQFEDERDMIKSEQREHLQDSFAPAEKSGLQVEFGGAAGEEKAQAGGASELIGIVIALIVLTITFGSLLTAGLPLGTAAIGVGIGILGITLATAFTTLSSTTSALAAMLGLAVGIDYALFIVSRYRTGVAKGMDPEEAIGHAVGTSGSAVVFAGSTVAIALAALAVCGIPFLTAMGLAAAGTVVIAVLIALTLVPALLGFAGRRALKGKDLERPRGTEETMGKRWVNLVTRHRVIAAVVPAFALLVLAMPVLNMRLGLPGEGTAPKHETKRQAYDLITKGFGAGANGQLTVVAELPSKAGPAAAESVATELGKLEDVAKVGKTAFDPDETIAVIGVTPKSGPESSATEDLVETIRDQTVTADGTNLLVAGATASNIDVSKQLSDSLPLYLIVVVGLALILLTIAFRSIPVPLLAILGFLLTIGASFGAVVAVFQEGTAAGLFGVEASPTILSFLPVLAIGILFGLAMDYQVFLVSRMREEHAHGAGAQDAVRVGFRHGARVVTAAALIMISVFAGFIVPEEPIIKSIGFALAVGILFDAFVVRMMIVPAVMAMLGARAWWLPKWLDRIIPNVDLEGAGLERRPEPEPAPRPTAEPAGAEA